MTTMVIHRARRGRVLWVLQSVLAALFLFAGYVKLTMPAAAMAQVAPLPVAFLRFIAVAELLGALGLILPGVFHVRRELTPLAAAGLVIIMIGATVVTLATGKGLEALIPAIVGGLAATVARGRTIQPV